jgi:sphingosine kinase
MGQTAAVPSPYYPSSFQLPMQARTVSKVMLLVNGSKYSKDSPIIADLCDVAGKRGVTVVYRESDYAGHIQKIVSTEDLTGIDVLCPVGGDGTVHEVVNALLRRSDAKDILVGIIPAGSGNNLAYDFGLPLTYPKVAMEAVCNGKYRVADVAEVRSAKDSKHDDFLVYSVQLVGWGATTRIIQRSEPLRWMGTGRYDVATVQTIAQFDIHFQATIRLFDAQPLIGLGSGNPPKEMIELDGTYAMVQSMTSIHCSQQLPLTPTSILDDGLLDVFIIRSGDDFSRAQFLSLFDNAKKGLVGEEDIEGLLLYRCRAYEVHPAADTDPLVMGPQTISLDGEMAGSPPYRVTAVPRCLRYICAGETASSGPPARMWCAACASTESESIVEPGLTPRA